MRRGTIAAAVTAAILAGAGAVPCQDRVHPFLTGKLATAGSSAMLPVYFVMADRLGYDHWFPRVNLLGADERRALVVRELRSHARDTQREVLARLRGEELAGRVAGVFSNWLGNFIQCRACPAVILGLADHPDLLEIRYDAAWPLEAVEDGRRAPLAGLPPGDGPVNTRADQVWALGFTGQGVVIMNADSGINVNHGDLVNRLWSNPGEIPGNGLDDDLNGFVDDVHGWNFYSNDANIADSGHGVLTAGCLVADGSCTGIVAGQAPGATVMTAKLGVCCPQNGPVNPAGEVAQWNALQYAVQMGAHVQTSSHSYKNGFIPPPTSRMHRDVGDSTLAAGLIRTNSVSNNGSVAGSATSLNRIPFNISAPGNLPCPYVDPNQTLVGRKGGVLGIGAHDVVSNIVVSYSPIGPYAWSLADLLAVISTYPLANYDPLNHDDYPWNGGASMGLLKPDLTGPTNALTATGGGTCGSGPKGGTSSSTPRVGGTLALWKCANMSLGPEDMAMIAHQSATPSGLVPGKENRWGAGRVDALAGLHLALCVHRIDGEPAWSVDHVAGTAVTVGLDTIPNRPVVIALGASRSATAIGGGIVGIGPPHQVLHQGSSGPTGDVSLTIPVPSSWAGLTFYSQAFTYDTGGVTGMTVHSNVIETRIVTPPFRLVASTSGGGAGDLQLSLVSVPQGASEGYCLFSTSTASAPGSGPLFGLWPTPLTALSLTATPAPGNPLHWTWPVAAPLFPAAPYLLGPGVVPLPPGAALDAVAAAYAPGYVFLQATPVVRIVF